MLNIPNEIKILCKQDSVRKNFRVHFPNGEYPDLTNESVVTESVTFTESLCSRDKFKFGLCEASTIQFEVVDTGNMKGMNIFCSLDIDVSSLSVQPEGCEQKEDLDYPSYSIPYGMFVVDSCQKQPDMEHRVVVAYSNENFIDYMLPASIWELKGYTWRINESLSFTLDDLIDLTFPSYSYNRKEMQDSREDYVREIVETCSIENDDYRIALAYEKVHMAIDGYSNCLFTFRAKYDKSAYKTALNDLRSRYGFTSNDRFAFDVDDIWAIHHPGDAFAYSFGTAFAQLTKSSGNITKVLGTPEGYAYMSNFALDSNPYTHFKQYRKYEASSTSSFELGYVIRKKPSDNTKYHYIWDENGTVMVPSALRVYQNNVIVESVDLGYLEYNRSLCGENGLLDFESVASFRNLWTLTVSSGTVASAVRAEDPSYRNNFINYIEKYSWRDIIESALEISGLVGHYNRNGYFELREIKMSNALYPSDILYPNFNIYPKERGGTTLTRTLYKSAWYDDYATRPIRYITCDNPSGGSKAMYNYEIPIQMYEEDISIARETAEIEEWNDKGRIVNTWLVTLLDNTLFYVYSSRPLTKVVVNMYCTTPPPWEEDDPEAWTHPNRTIDLYPIGSDLLLDGKDERSKYVTEHASGISSVAYWYDVTEGTATVGSTIVNSAEIYADDDGASYDITDNYFIKNRTHTDEQLEQIFIAMGKKVGGLQYTPSSITCIGQPYIEPGDWINVVGQKDAFDSLILERTIKGIQTLTDSYESKGE